MRLPSKSDGGIGAGRTAGDIGESGTPGGKLGGALPRAAAMLTGYGVTAAGFGGFMPYG